MPFAEVDAVDPIALHMTLAETALPDPGIDQRDIPQQILDSFGEEISVTGGTRHVYVTLGQFSIIRLERSTQLLIPVFDYCIPSGSCQPVGSISCSSCDDPCEMFESVCFPVDDFFPAGIAEGGADTPTNCCSCGGK